MVIGDFCGVPHCNCIRRNIFRYNSACPYNCMIPNRNARKDNRVYTDKHMIPNGSLTLALFPQPSGSMIMGKDHTAMGQHTMVPNHNLASAKIDFGTQTDHAVGTNYYPPPTQISDVKKPAKISDNMLNSPEYFSHFCPFSYLRADDRKYTTELQLYCERLRP